MNMYVENRYRYVICDIKDKYIDFLYIYPTEFFNIGKDLICESSCHFKQEICKYLNKFFLLLKKAILDKASKLS